MQGSLPPRSRRMSLVLSLALGSACIPVPPADPASTRVPRDDGDGIVMRPRAPGSIYAVGEIRGFELRQSGQRIGGSWGRYLGKDAAGLHQFETRIELTFPGRAPARSDGALWLDDRGQLVRGFERSSASELQFRRDGDRLLITDGEREDEVTYAPQRQATAFMAHSAILHAELMFALRGLPSREPSWRLLSLSGGAPVEWSARVVESADDGNLVELQTSLGETITLVDGRIARIEVEATELEIVAEATPAWPSWTVEAPRTLTWSKPVDARFEVRPLELPGKPDEPLLAGELLLPTERAAPLPAVLMLSATGQEDRYGFAGPPPVDLGSHELGDALAQAGIAVLRFDDRGRGQSEPGPRGFLAQVDDARRALGTLLVQPEIDPDRVVVVGHGEGGLRALVLASERADDVHAVALLATPGRPYEQVLRAQAAARVEQLPPDVREQVRQQQRTMLDDLVSGRAVPEELAPQAQWLREVFAVDPAGLLARLRVPVLVAQGGKDFEVDPVADAGALERAGKRRGKLSVRRYPELDHLFKPEPGLSSPERYLIERRVDTTFITDVIAWVDRVTRTGERGRKSQAAGRTARSSDGASK